MVYYSNPGTQDGVQNKDSGTVTESLVQSVLWCRVGSKFGISETNRGDGIVLEV